MLFYESEEEKSEWVLPFVREGLDNGEAVIYVSDEGDVEPIRREFENLGIDLAHKGLRIVDSEDWYLEHGRINKERVVEKLMDATRQALKKGYKGLRVTGELSAPFKNNLVEQLIDYESSLPRRFQFPLTAICRYKVSDITSYDKGRHLPDLLRTHHFVITPKLQKVLNFDTYYLELINETLDNIFGDATRQTLLHRLEKTYGLPRSKIPMSTSEFRRALESLLGEGGTMIEETILKKLYDEIGLRYDSRR